MKTSRLSPLVVGIVGSVLCLAIAGALFYFLIKPTQEQTAVQQGIYEQNYPDSTAAAQKKAAKELNDAKYQVAQIHRQWLQKDAALMPRYDVSGTTPGARIRATRQLSTELGQNLGPLLERQLHTSGVTTDTAISLPAPPVNPNDITNAPVVIPLGPISVHGDFRHILTHFYNWQYFNRLVLVDSLAFDGSSPFMTGTYTATVYIFPQGADKLAPNIPAAGAAGGAAGGGAAGGYPGGSSGGGYPGGSYPGGGSSRPSGGGGSSSYRPPSGGR